MGGGGGGGGSLTLKKSLLAVPMSSLGVGVAGLLALGMLSTGSINTIMAYYADITESKGQYSVHKFNHPFVQSLGMFLGEVTCLFAFYFVSCYNRRRNRRVERADRKFRPWVSVLFSLHLDLEPTLSFILVLPLTVHRRALC